MIHHLHAYWTGKRGARRMPSRADIDPCDLKPLLPNLLIVDLVDDPRRHPPLRVRYRLLGTKVVAASGNDFTGKYLDELVAADVERQWQEYYGTVREDGAPLLGDARVPTSDGGQFTYEFAIFPLSDDDATVGQCLSIEDYGRMNERLYEMADKMPSWWPRDRMAGG